jgi:hypothetical protein
VTVGLGATLAVRGRRDAELTEGATVTVTERMGEATSFRVRLELDAAHADLPLLTDGRVDPGSELSVLVPAGRRTACLVKGPVRGQQLLIRDGVAGSYVEVIGADSSVAMDREAKSVIWKSSDSDAVRTILGRCGYASLDVETTSTKHIEKKHVLVQRDSDLRFVRRLARRNGFLFWVEADARGRETAHFRRPPLREQPAATLTAGARPPVLNGVEISWDVERPTSTSGSQLDLNTKNVIDGSVQATPQAALGSVPLNAIASGTRSVLVSAPADDAGDLRSRGEGALIDSDFFVEARCRTTAAALGAVVRANTVVELAGVGGRHSGIYMVRAVHHSIDSVVHQMDIEMVRNGWGR